MIARSPRGRRGKVTQPGKDVAAPPARAAKAGHVADATDQRRVREPGSPKANKKIKVQVAAKAGVAAVRAEQVFARFAAAEPEPKGELESVNTFTLLVAVVLSAQATDAGVNKATRALFAIADTPRKMAALGVERVSDLIKTIGLYRNKAKNVIALSEQLLADHGGEVPHDRAALEALSGVGRKTANVVLNIAFGEPTMAVDTHVFRVAHRLDLSQGRTPLAVEEDLLRVVPARFAQHAHHWLILHGRYVCKARKPECARCLVNDLCFSADKQAPKAVAT